MNYIKSVGASLLCVAIQFSANTILSGLYSECAAQTARQSASADMSLNSFNTVTALPKAKGMFPEEWQTTNTLYEARNQTQKFIGQMRTSIIPLSDAQKTIKVPMPKIKTQQYKNAILSETGLLTGNEQANLQKSLESIFTVHLEIVKTMQKIQKENHDKRAGIFESRLPLKYAFDELFEQILAKDYAIKQEEITPYITNNKADGNKLQALRNQKSYLEMQYNVMLFLGSLLHQNSAAVIKIFKYISTYNKGVSYNNNLVNIVAQAFGTPVSGCPNVTIDQQFVIGLNAIVNEANKIHRNKAAEAKARANAEIREKYGQQSYLQALTNLLQHNVSVVQNANNGLFARIQTIKAPNKSSLIMEPQTRAYFIKMFPNNFSKDVFNVRLYTDIMLLAWETFSRMSKELSDFVNVCNKCGVPQDERLLFNNTIKQYIGALSQTPAIIFSLYSKTMSVQNYIMNGQ